MIIGLVTSVNYDDFLKLTLPTTCNICDKVYVLTKEGDPSIAVARDNSCMVMEYDGWEEDGACFNKSGALRAGQEYLHDKHPDDWIVLADADILLPDSLGNSIRSDATDLSAMYSVARIDYATPQRYRENRPGYYPFTFSGYCQIYHASTQWLYPFWSKDAGMCDCLFRDCFTKWIRLPGIARHFGSDHVNWAGRKSERWSL